MVLDHFGALEADFCRYYQLDLPEALWGERPMSVRRIRNLVEWLPPDSAVMRSVNPHPGWGHTEELLAALIQTVDVGNLFVHHAHFKSPHPEPVQIRRPWEAARAAERRQSTPDEIRAFFGRGSVRYTPQEG